MCSEGVAKWEIRERLLKTRGNASRGMHKLLLGKSQITVFSGIFTWLWQKWTPRRPQNYQLSNGIRLRRRFVFAFGQHVRLDGRLSLHRVFSCNQAIIRKTAPRFYNELQEGEEEFLRSIISLSTIASDYGTRCGSRLLLLLRPQQIRSWWWLFTNIYHQPSNKRRQIAIYSSAR